jgi:hypothetical protein
MRIVLSSPFARCFSPHAGTSVFRSVPCLVLLEALLAGCTECVLQPRARAGQAPKCNRIRSAYALCAPKRNLPLQRASIVTASPAFAQVNLCSDQCSSWCPLQQ